MMELLSSYLILLTAFENRENGVRFEQHNFDQLMNLIVIFCKIIKQNIKRMEDLEKSLLMIVRTARSDEETF